MKRKRHFIKGCGRTRHRVSAEALARILEPHLGREDADVLRTLALLAPLAAGEIDPAMLEDFSNIDNLEATESELDLEHTAIIEAGDTLFTVAQAEGADGVTEFAERLLLRVRLDEEVFYPAAALIRQYLKLKLNSLGPTVRAN